MIAVDRSKKATFMESRKKTRRIKRGARKRALYRRSVKSVEHGRNRTTGSNVNRKVGGKTTKPEKAKAAVPSPRELRDKKEKEVYRTDVKRVIEEISANNLAMDYLYKNVSKRAGDVISALNTPKTDERIAEELDIKINTVRRILNIMYGYGITNYNVIKNSKGWLSFLWSVNLKKVNGFYGYISKNENNVALITENSNDYFLCKGCYNDNKLVFDFDSAFEAGFKCVLCGGKLQRLDREEARQVLETRDLDGIAQSQL